ncbi:uncharacterized WD repeat-containing protein all2124-like [Lampris incognitus]|uniref:uncharacterized WD repeat-containing protein all2124-like n=1 Tax=Lampris incognitus TaxID=2546036 RepID=UPI0024B61C68|nr:uncharacterized WD repeat-containing protein all2124-like [Lampris incognitus]
MSCQFSGDGTLLAVGLTNGAIKLHKTGTGSLIRTLRNVSNTPVTALRFTSSPQANSLLLAAYACGTVRCWYVCGGECLWAQREVTEELNPVGGGREENRETLCLSLSPSGERAATGGSDSAVHLYDLATRQRLMTCKASSCRTTMDGHRSRVFAVTFHPLQEKEFISAGWDNTIQFWDSRQERAVSRIWGPLVCGEALQIDPNVNHILSGSWRSEKTLEVWDYSSGKKVYEVPQDPLGDSKIYTCHWLGDGHIMAAGSQVNQLKVIRRSSMETVSRLQGLPSPVFSSSVCLSGKWSGLIAATSGACVYLLERSVADRK